VFVRQSIEAVGHTFVEALILVVLVVLIFLQTWRASIIPLLALPVSLVGTFRDHVGAGLHIKHAFAVWTGCWAIGIVVDDAIVVVENVRTKTWRLGLQPREATQRANGRR